jgi:uroporphyrinogen-III synthase
MSILKEKIVISTRPLNEDDSIKNYLVERGATVLDFPMIKIFPITLTDETTNLLLHIKDYQWIVFTSKNAVKYFFQFLNELGINLEVLSDIKIAVIGKKTAAEVVKYYRQPDLISSGNNSADLSYELVEVLKSTDKVLLALAELANDKLENRISDLCIVTRFNVYLTKDEDDISLEIIQRIKNDDYHIILFTSPSGFRHFSKIMIDNNITANIRAACIGTTTEEEMLKNNCKPILVSLRSEGENFARQIESYLSKNQKC